MAYGIITILDGNKVYKRDGWRNVVYLVSVTVKYQLWYHLYCNQRGEKYGIFTVHNVNEK